MNTPNPLLTPFSTQHGTAPFSLIKNEHYIPAFKAAIEEARADMNNIINSVEAPSFENTIMAMDFMGMKLNIIQGVFFNLNSAETNNKMQEIAQETAPMFSEFSNDVSLNEQLFTRVKSVYDQRESLTLSAEQQTLLTNSYLSFVRNGANLSETDKATYREITAELSQIGLQFQQNVLAETNAYELLITEEQELAGLPPFVLDAAADDAKAKGKEGWLFSLQHPSFVPFMKYADNRELREQLFKASSRKGNQDNAHDNKKIIERMLELKLQKANLLGYASHADFVLEQRMAKSVERVYHFIDELHLNSRSFAIAEYDEMQRFAQRQGLKDDLQRWDWAYYAEKLKNTKFGFKEEELKPYFQLEKVVDAVFGLATTLYDITFKEQKSIEVYHPDVKAYEVFDESGEFLAVFYADFFPRESKRSGAWMTEYQGQYITADGSDHRPHISIVCNFTKPTASSPSLLTFDEVVTLLHEFGHALHGMLTRCHYPSTSGTNVFWDFVELPSQIHENWAFEKKWLDTFAVHYQTGKTIPAELIDKLLEAKNFLAGYASERQLSFAMLDMAYYSQTEPMRKSIPEFEAESMQATELMPPVEGALMSTAFSHIFAGGYSAGYYSYKWAEVLDADAFAVFKANGVFDKATAYKFRYHILEKGGSEHPMKLYKRFRGQEPTAEALLKREGLC
ncbi:MAG: M3 family metallopeptidase [Mangrovibacterium sp.]